MLIKFSDILPNPYRDLNINPLNPEKVAELVNSINRSGFWDNVVVRPSPEHNGKFETAYGHHRLEAAKKAGMKEADFIVKPFDNATMITVMKDDNLDFRHTALATLEAVRAVVEALAKGDIAPFDINPKVNKSLIRFAPRYTPGNLVEASMGDTPAHPYTALDIAKILGYTESAGKGSIKADEKVVSALRALFLIQEGIASYSDFSGLSTAQMVHNTTLKFEQVLERKAKAKVEAEQHAAKEALKLHKQESEAAIAEAQKALYEAERATKAAKEEEEREAAEVAQKEKQKQLHKTYTTGASKHLELARQYIAQNKKTIPEGIVNKLEVEMAVIKEDLKGSPDLNRAKELEDSALSIRNLLLDAKLVADAKLREKTKQEKIKAKKKEKLKRQLDWYDLLQEKHKEDVKILIKEDWTSEERETLRQKALDVAEAIRQQAAMFLPPLSGKREGKNVKR